MTKIMQTDDKRGAFGMSGPVSNKHLLQLSGCQQRRYALPRRLTTTTNCKTRKPYLENRAHRKLV